jgi:hypothetical protein
MKLNDFKLIKKDYGMGTQTVLDFGKYQLSVITGGYGNDTEPYEIAVIESKDGANNGFVQLPGITGPDDSVRGYMTEEEVNIVISKLHSITGIMPKQVLHS